MKTLERNFSSLIVPYSMITGASELEQCKQENQALQDKLDQSKKTYEEICKQMIREAVDTTSELANNRIGQLEDRVDEALKKLRLAQNAGPFNEMANHIFAARLILRDSELLNKLNGDKNAG
jgi:gas vesicle protein